METKTTIIDAMNELTDVIFLWERPEYGVQRSVFAFFPNEDFTLSGLKTSYAHIGQHSACSKEYARDCKRASKKEYEALKQELESIGYNLNILKSI